MKKSKKLLRDKKKESKTVQEKLEQEADKELLELIEEKEIKF